MNDSASVDKMNRRILEYVAVHQGDRSRDSEMGEMVSRSPDAEGLWVLAVRHKLAAALADAVTQSETEHMFHPHLMQHMWDYLDWNVRKSLEYTDEAIRIHRYFRHSDVPALITKGIVVQSTLYAAPGTRQFNDIDFMLDAQHSKRAQLALAPLGYGAANTLDRKSGSLSPLSRADTLPYLIYPDHLPHHNRLTEASVSQVVPAFNVDVSFSLTWHRCAWQVPTGVVMGARRQAEIHGLHDSEVVDTLSEHDEFLFLVLHLFREAWFTASSHVVRISQLGDVVRSWNRLGLASQELLVSRVAEFHLQAPLSWVVWHVDALFGTKIVEALELQSYCDEQWLCSGFDQSLGFVMWSGDFRDVTGLAQNYRSASPEEVHRFAREAVGRET